MENLFTLESFGTLATASAAVVVVSNTYRYLLKSNSVLPAFITSIIVSIVGAYKSQALSDLSEIILVILNGCLLFCTSLGIQEGAVGIKNRAPRDRISQQGLAKIPWLSSWICRN